jgi:hypothetical protein
MPEIKNTFIKSKMNKDLDSRLLPNGEYRDAQNVSVSRSEGSDVGSLENILGNSILTNLKSKIETLEKEKLQAFYNQLTLGKSSIVLDQLEIIGYFNSLSNNTVYLFLTDYRDSSNNRLRNFANPDNIDTTVLPNQFVYKGAGCYIVSYNLNLNESRVLVAGNFLNFSKTHPIHGVNLLENLLFFTDNRNQPRKINVEKASINTVSNGSWESWSGDSSTQPYYYNEDDVSVAKFAPYDSFRFIDSNNNSTLISNSEEFLPAHIAAIPTGSFTSSDDTISISGDYIGSATDNLNIKSGDRLTILLNADENDSYVYTVSSVTGGTNTSIVLDRNLDENLDTGDLILIQRKNFNYDENYIGDTLLLKDKFAKFSYRFKYEDDEYSLMAPFSQAAFVPRQFGYFINGDETIAAEATDVKFMENRVDQVKLNVTLPYAGDEIAEKLKVKELQILVKNSDETAVRVIEDVNVSRLGTSTNYEYNYLSAKPIKTLPEADLTRVHDKIPIRAMSQEVVGNRVIYGNYLDKHSSPDNLNYDLIYLDKSISGSDSEVSIELPCHTLKQNRTYQVGVVLVDRYGRASNVILNNADNVTANSNSTITAPYVDYDNPALSTFFGKTLEMTIRSEIPSTDPKPNYPGLYSSTNPLGYYTYRIVVKQQEQDYYNVYTPGALAGEILWDVTSGKGNEPADREDQLPRYISTSRISMISLFGDNINKVPRELKTSTNANDTTYGSETILFNRVNPIYDTRSFNKQSDVTKQGESVISIEPFKDLGAWTTTKGALYPNGNLDSSAEPQPWYPYYKPLTNKFSFHDIFFNAQANPFIATIETDFKIGATPVQLAANQSEIERAWQDLGVFETRPIKSALDIYWESSTSGLITDYNNEAADSSTPAGVVDTAGNKTAEGETIQYLHNEGMVEGDNVTTVLNLTDAAGNVLGNPYTVTLDDVGDGNSDSRLSEFDLIQPSNNSFIIQTAARQVFTSDSNVLENFTFDLNVVSNATPPDWTGVRSIQLTNLQMQNVTPVITDQPASSYDFTLYSYSPETVIFEITKGTPTSGQVKAVNGSSDTLQNTEDLVYEIVDASGGLLSPITDFKTIYQDSSDPNKFIFETIDNYWIYNQPQNSNNPRVNFYLVKLKVTDAGGTGKVVFSNNIDIRIVTRI